MWVIDIENRSIIEVNRHEKDHDEMKST